MISLRMGHGTRDIVKKILDVDLKRGVRGDLGLPGKRYTERIH